MPGSVGPLAGMLATAVLILALAYGATRWIAARGTPGLPLGPLRVIAQLPLGRGERLVLVRVHETCCMLLGVTEHQITLLRTWENEEAARFQGTGQPRAAPAFWEILSESLKKRR